MNVLNEPRGDRYVVLVAGGRSGKTNELIRRTVEAVRAAMPSEVIVREEGVAQALAAERKRIMDEINDNQAPDRVVLRPSCSSFTLSLSRQRRLHGRRTL